MDSTTITWAYWLVRLSRTGIGCMSAQGTVSRSLAAVEHIQYMCGRARGQSKGKSTVHQTQTVSANPSDDQDQCSLTPLLSLDDCL